MILVVGCYHPSVPSQFISFAAPLLDVSRTSPPTLLLVVLVPRVNLRSKRVQVNSIEAWLHRHYSEIRRLRISPGSLLGCQG
jgi:hypothetical protein